MPQDPVKLQVLWEAIETFFCRELSRKLHKINQRGASSVAFFSSKEMVRRLDQSICLVSLFKDGNVRIDKTIFTEGRLGNLSGPERCLFYILINRRSCRYIPFVFDDKDFHFRALPLGLSVNPYVFTRVLKTVLRYIRRSGIRVHT